ncbi:MAG: hypothetical protein WKF29_02005 [Thermoleophilaceae bacterium]
MKTTAKQKRAANRKRQRIERQARASSARVQTADATDPAMVYWATPKVWSRRCDACGCKGSEVYRHCDQSSLCGVCGERLGAEVRESKAARRATGRAGRLAR